MLLEQSGINIADNRNRLIQYKEREKMKFKGIKDILLGGGMRLILYIKVLMAVDGAGLIRFPIQIRVHMDIAESFVLLDSSTMGVMFL